MVLVGFAEALSAPEVVWSLVDDGYDVVAFSRRGKPSALRHSRHVVCHEICPPESDVENSLSDLRSLVRSLNGDVGNDRPILFPLDDIAVWLCSKLHPVDRWLLAGPHGPSAELALNKSVQTKMALDAGFNVPHTMLARTSEDLLAFCKAQPFPIILKQAECVWTNQNRIENSRKWICANSEEIERVIAKWQERAPLLVQPFITGTGEGIFGLAAFDGVRAWSGHRRLRMMNPQGSGASACISQEVTENLKFKVERLIRDTGWRGLFMIELLRDQFGVVWFIEINGRPWGSMALSRRAGLEYPAWHVMLALDEQCAAGRAVAPTVGVVCRNVGRELMNLLFVLRGPKSKALSNWPSFWKTVRDVLKVQKGEVFYNWRRDDAKVFWADCFYTIYGTLFKPRT